MSGAEGRASEESLLARVDELVAGLDPETTPLPDAPAIQGALFLHLLDQMDEATVDSAMRSATTDARTPEVLEASALGRRLGSVRLEAVLGEGGMGTVYRGYDEKLGRAVAVKTIRARHRLAAAARARFLREARLLSRLNHPAICQVYDLVQRPEADYLLLELVEGETLRAWLERAPAQGERLALAIALAEAVAIAHRAGVVHRDLKPDNVMCVGPGRVKVLDFGIARADDADRGEVGPESAIGGEAEEEARDDPRPARFETTLGSVVGTPAYMSPEQARGEPVTSAADVWALGVLLHELVTGARPRLDRERAGGGVSLAPGLDREIARLLEAMLSDDPVARPSAESVRDRLRHVARRPVRRRRWALAALAAAVVVAAAVRYVVDVSAERRAAVAARDEAEEVARFLVSIFEVVDPRQALGEEVTARELLERGATRIDELEGSPVVRARLEATLGSVYTALGAHERAATHLERALSERRRLLGEEHPVTLATGVAWSELELHRGHVEAAEAAADGVARRAADLPVEQEDRVRLLVEALDLRGTARRLLGRLAEAETDRRQALALAEASPGVDSEIWAALATGLALVLHDQGRAEEAVPFARRALEVYEAILPEAHPDRAVAMNNLALVLTAVGQSDEALEIQRRELEIDRRTLGDAHPAVGVSHDNLAVALFRLGRFAEAETHVRRAIEIFTASGGEHHLDLATGYHNLGVLARETNRPEEAVAHLGRALAIYGEALGEGAPASLGTRRALATVFERGERWAEASATLADAWAIEERRAEREGAAPAPGTLVRLALAWLRTGRTAEAEEAGRRAVELGEGAWGVSDPRLGPALDALAEILEAKGAGVEAAEVRERRAALAASPS